MVFTYLPYWYKYHAFCLQKSLQVEVCSGALVVSDNHSSPKSLQHIITHNQLEPPSVPDTTFRKAVQDNFEYLQSISRNSNSSELHAYVLTNSAIISHTTKLESIMQNIYLRIVFSHHQSSGISLNRLAEIKTLGILGSSLAIFLAS
ncbi:unnamed protein product [Allacma fusca]|uniref:Uncharacterized protein n=1 Tax=Allacma fusca TaxID=39272 RepID=A0A8J2K7L4_9HEXA|nr:unnamed protein product [Allacma fusca]